MTERMITVRGTGANRKIEQVPESEFNKRVGGEAGQTDLSKMTKAELFEEAKNRGVETNETMTKQQIIEALG